jgi:hypothetical protein
MNTKLDVDMSVIGILGEKLYTQPLGIFILRECLQNAIDARASQIDITHNGHELTVTDNGVGIEDFQSLFLTIGGSSKHNQSETVGGYGIAKLSIMAAEDWSIASRQGTVTRDILMSGAPIDGTEYLQSGTRVSVRLQSSVNRNQLKDIARLSIVEGCSITHNDETLIPPVMETGYLANGSVAQFTTELESYSNVVLVRLNGQFQYQSDYLSTPGGRVYIYDIETHVNAYDPDYPLNATREGFNPCVSSAYYQWITALRVSLEELHLKQSLDEQNIRKVFEGIYVGGTMEKQDVKRYSLVWKTYKRYLAQIAALRNQTLTHDILITDLGGFQAALIEVGGKKYFAINPQDIHAMDVKAHVLSLALHEYNHLYHDGHYESYATGLTKLTELVLDNIFNKTFRI